MKGGTQLRYWSICNNQGLTSGATTGPCLADEEVPINAHRDYTIVVSLPQDRPKNATAKCGVAWMNYGTAGGRLHAAGLQTLLILRNLSTTAHPAFPHAIQNINTPSTVKVDDGRLPADRQVHRRGKSSSTPAATSDLSLWEDGPPPRAVRDAPTGASSSRSQRRRVLGRLE